MIITLRDYQQQLKNDIYAQWNAGLRNVLAVSKTGSGKSIVVSDIILDGTHSNMQQAVIAHRNELVSQMSIHIANRGISHRIIGSDATIRQITRQHRKLYGRSFVHPSASTAVIGVDTLVSRKDKLVAWANQIDRWVVDESHHVLKSNKWGTAVEMFRNAHGLGVTATPQRADGNGLGRDFDGVFDRLITSLEMRELIDRGYLSDYEIVCPKSDINTDELKMGASGDWTSKKLKSAACKSKIVGDVVQNYIKYSSGKQAICFATDVETSGKIAGEFVAAEIRAASLCAQTNPLVREKYIEEFRTGQLAVLVNVDLFDEGFDVPACETIIMARPTASLGKYHQMVGRGLRPAPGKVALIIDHVSNVIRHGLPDRVIPWSLARRDKRSNGKDPDEIALTVCKFCTRPYEKFYTKCPYCGKEPPLPDPRVRTIEMVEGDLILLDRAALERMRRNIELESPADIAERVSHVAGEYAGKGVANKQRDKIAAQERLRETIAQWAGYGRADGFSDRELHKKFYLMSGMDVLSALSKEHSRAEYDMITERIRSWYKS